MTHPPRRADALRNRDQILDVARKAFADPEASVSMAEVARRAGVGMATLYRNFPGRRELLEALYAYEVDAVCAAAVTVEGETPGAVLRAWLHRFVAFFTSKHRVVAELLAESGPGDPVFKGSRARVLIAGQPLLVAAQQAREIRDDLSLEQILELVVAVAKIQGNAGYVAPILQAALDGLRPVSGSHEM